MIRLDTSESSEDFSTEESSSLDTTEDSMMDDTEFSEDDTEIDDDDLEVLSCSLCDKYFATAESLEKHKAQCEVKTEITLDDE